MIFGDSWTEGYSATPEARGFAYLTGAALGWDITVLGSGGTGYIAPGPNGVGSYYTRMRALDVDASVRVLVIQGGLNDTQQDRSAVYSAATDTVALSREKFPSAQIVVLGPAPTSSTPNDGLTNVSRNIYEASADANAYAIMPIAQQWITGSNVGDVIDPATIHPSTAGHAYLAERATAALREIGPSTT